MLVMGDIFGSQETLVSQSGQCRVQFIKIISMDKKVEIHGRSGITQNAQGEATDDRVSNFLPAESSQQSPQYALEIHGC